MNDNYIYPLSDDENWHSKINNKMEFKEAFNKKINNISDINKIDNFENKNYFSLKSHQLFVRNFLSERTPYNNLLLYHGLGTGKTCSAIGIAFERIKYMIQTNRKQKIVVICSENVKENFKKQIFSNEKLFMEEDTWILNTCIGKQLLEIINPMNIVNPLSLTRNDKNEKYMKKLIIHNIKKFIDTWFDFIGYQTFANICGNIDVVNQDSVNFQRKMSSLLDRFDNTLIIIDEVHNIRMTDDDKKTAVKLRVLVEYCKNIKLLLLSATPMFDTYEEIIWLINLMNINDEKYPIEVKDVFDKNGNFLKDKYNEVGKDLFLRKIKSYVSFVEGGNPFTFPFRLYPKDFETNKSSIFIKSYPKISWNNSKITKFQHKVIDYYAIQMNKDSVQDKFYNHCVKNMVYDGSDHKHQILSYISSIVFLSNEEKFNLSSLQNNYNEYLGETGLSKLFSTGIKKLPLKLKDKYKNFFSINNLKHSSTKIHNVCQRISNNKEGISLIYSEKIYAGIYPMALALETMGFTRYDHDDLLPDNNNKKKQKRKYMIISGDDFLSPKKKISKHISDVVKESNVDGSQIEVILISRTGAEGIDLKYIRNIFIIDPWYNINRLEQIIGRGIRENSHKLLPFEKRNCSIFMYALYSSDVETIDMYIYRTAEGKIKKIGNILRLLKENSVDCLLSSDEQLIYDKNIDIKLINSYDQEIDYTIQKKPYSSECDFLESCNYKCNNKISYEELDDKTYTINHALLNLNDIKFIIRDLFKEKHFYSKFEMYLHINHRRQYSMEQLELALDEMIKNKYELVFDKYGRKGNIKKYEDVYLFHPLEIPNENISYSNKVKPVFNKHEFVDLKTDDSFIENQSTSEDYKIFVNNIEELTNKIKKFIYRIDDYLNEQYLDKNEKNENYPHLTNDDIIKNIVTMMFYEKLDKQKKLLFLNEENSILNGVIDNYTYNIEILVENTKLATVELLIIDFDSNWTFFIKEDTTWRKSTEISYHLEQLMENESFITTYESLKSNKSNLYGLCSKNKNDFVFKIYKKGETKTLNKNCKTIDELEQINIFNGIFNDIKFNLEKMVKHVLKKDNDEKTKRSKVTIEEKCLLFEYLFRYKQMFFSHEIHFIPFDKSLIKSMKVN